MARTEEFDDGAAKVRQPQFASVQQQANRNFQALSVLDTPNIIPNQNGLGEDDLQRKIVGRTETPSGRSKATFDRQLWLHHQMARRDQLQRTMTNGEA